MRMYIGTVVEVVSNKPYLIKFNIPDIYTDESKSLLAVPLCRLSSMPLKDDEIVIIKPEDDLDLFYYVMSPDNEEPDSILIQYDKDNLIKMSMMNRKINIDMTCSGNITINSNGSIKINSGSNGVTINDHLKVNK